MRTSLKVRKIECTSASNEDACGSAKNCKLKNWKQNILNEKAIEERCEMYYKTTNTKLEAVDKKVRCEMR